MKAAGDVAQQAQGAIVAERCSSRKFFLKESLQHGGTPARAENPDRKIFASYCGYGTANGSDFFLMQKLCNLCTDTTLCH